MRAPGRPRSVGIVTFSLAQQVLIEDLSDAARLKDSVLDAAFGGDEPVFIKNLENVQGDERDVMLFSVCYGPDRTGKVTMNFGPLSRDGGERRLNVAITRARERLEIFSTLRADQIDLRRTRSVGSRHLKTFLEYAAHGMRAIDAAVTAEGGATESPFEAEVLSRLEALGWEVRCQIGVSGYRIDLGVIDPERPGAYLMGIECDGATYHSSRCARERDRLRQSVLEGLGRRIHRIWSTDWWLNPDRQVERLQLALEEAKRDVDDRGAALTTGADAVTDATGADGLSAAAPVEGATGAVAHPPDTPQPDDARPGAEEAPPARLSLQERLASLPASPHLPDDASIYTPAAEIVLGDIDAFRDPASLPAIGQRLAEIVAEISPIQRDDLYRQVMASWQIKQLGKRIRGHIDQAWRALPTATRPALEGDTFWAVGIDPDGWRGFRVPGEGDAGSERGAGQIPPAELANAAAWVLEGARTLKRDELAKATAALFQIRRMGRGVREAMSRGIDHLVASGRCLEEGTRIRMDD